MAPAIQARSNSQIFGLKMYFSYNWAKSRNVEGPTGFRNAKIYSSVVIFFLPLSSSFSTKKTPSVLEDILCFS